MSKFLIIQTAFIGDVILATPVIEKLYAAFPDAQIDFLLRKGSEGLFLNHPKIKKLLIWNKKERKYQQLFKLIKEIRKTNYDYVINLQRFFSTGIMTAFSKGKVKIGFNKNPLSFCYSISVEHNIGNGKHEVERNLDLIKSLVRDLTMQKPVLYPSESDYKAISQFQKEKYVCFAPASVWYTKQLPFDKSLELINMIPDKIVIYFLGSNSDYELCQRLTDKSGRKNSQNLCGKISLLQSAALMQGALMNYVNDSAPLHMASATNAATTAFFCSTIPDFGFGPLADHSVIKQTEVKLECRPCGLHGKRECPEGHFKCGFQISMESIGKEL